MNIAKQITKDLNHGDIYGQLTTIIDAGSARVQPNPNAPMASTSTEVARVLTEAGYTVEGRGADAGFVVIGATVVDHFDPQGRNGLGERGFLATTPAGIERFGRTEEQAVLSARRQEEIYRDEGTLDEVVARLG